MAEEPQIGTDQTATGNADGKELWLFHSESLPNIEGLLSPSLTREYDFVQIQDIHMYVQWALVYNLI